VGTIAIRELVKSFGAVEVLKRISLDIAEGEFLTLLGPSGCGKTTLLRILAGLERQTSGSVAIDGRTVDDVPAKARDIAMVFQSYALYPHMTAAQNIALPLMMRRMGAAHRLPWVGRMLPGTRDLAAGIARDVGEVAQALDIAHLLGRKPGQLSGGQKQRVALGRAMVRRPAAFLLDEPLSNLDAKLRVQMRAELADLHRRLGATMVYVTHDQAEAMTMSDRVAVMGAGRILQLDAPQRIYDDPDDLAVAEFVGSPKINILPGRGEPGGIVDCLGLRAPSGVAVEAGAALHVGVRPEHLRLCAPDAVRALKGRVRLVEHLGPDSMLHVDIEGVAVPVIARAEPHATADIATGDTVGLALPETRLLVFAADGARVRATKRERAAVAAR
jgi:multiple sugar transport system ATP-binding protein